MLSFSSNYTEIVNEVGEKILEQTPLKCYGEPQFIAKAILALVDNDFITGQLLAVDGGRELV